MAVSKLKFNADGSVSFTKPLKTGSDSISGNMVRGRGEGDDGGFSGDNAGVDSNNDAAGGEEGREKPDLSSNFLSEDKDDKTVSLDVGVIGGAEETPKAVKSYWDRVKDQVRETGWVKALGISVLGVVAPEVVGPVVAGLSLYNIAKPAIDDLKDKIDASDLPESEKEKARQDVDKAVNAANSEFNVTDAHGDGNENNEPPTYMPTEDTTIPDLTTTTGLTTTTPSTNQTQVLGAFGPQTAPPQGTPSNKYSLYEAFVDKALGLTEDGTMDERTAFFADQAGQNTEANQKAANEYERSIQFINKQGGEERQKYQEKLDYLDRVQGESGQNYRTTLGGLESDLRNSTGVLKPQQTRVAGLGNLSGISKMQREQHEGLNQFNKDRRLSELEDIAGATTRGASGYEATTGLLDRGTTNALGLRDNRITAADKAYANAAAQAPGNSALATLTLLSDMAGQQLTAMTGVEKANISANASMANAATAAAASRYGVDQRRLTALDQLAAGDKKLAIDTELRKLGYDIDQQRVDQGEAGTADKIYTAIRATPVLLDAISKGMATVDQIIEATAANKGENEDIDTFMQRFDWGSQLNTLDTAPYRYDTGLPGVDL